MIFEEKARSLTPKDYLRMQIGRRYWRCDLLSIPKEAVYKKLIEKFIKNLKQIINDGCGALLYGDYRQGKTGAGVCLLKEVVSHGGTALMLKADSLMSTYIDKLEFEDRETVWKRACTVDLLLIDDLGSEHSKEFGSSLVERIIRSRYDNKKSIIITMNGTMSDLKMKYPSSIKVLQSILYTIPVECSQWMQEEKKKVDSYFL